MLTLKKKLFDFFTHEDSISKNLIYRIVAVITAVFIILISINYIISLKKTKENTRTRGELIFNTFSSVIIEPVWSFYIMQLNSIMTSYIQFEEVASIKIVYYDQVLELKKKDYKPEYTTLFQNKIEKNGETLGYAYMEITDEHIRMSLLRDLLFNLFILLVILTVTIETIRRLVKKHLAEPVQELIANIDIIAEGNYSHVLPAERHSELNSIINTINKMSKQISNREKQVTIARQFLGNVIESIPSAILVVDETGGVIQYNRAALSIMEIITAGKMMSGNAVPDKKFWDLFPFLNEYREIYPDIIEKQRSLRFSNVLTESRYFNITILPLIDQERKGIVISMDDVTDITLKEQHLQQIQKMETIGTLAGGIAHDFNNALGGIIGSVSLLKHKLEKNHQVDETTLSKFVHIIEDSGHRASDMVKQLLALSRKQELTYAPVDLNEILLNVINICESTFDKSIKINTTYPEEKVIINADPTHIHQVLLNLCINADHSMTIMRNPGEEIGGEMTVVIDMVRIDEYFKSRHSEAADTDYWRISITDSGIGIDSKNISKIFDPFFTTKDKNKGTGLGLAMVYNIIKQHSGFIDVYSEPGIGSSFNVFIPVFHNQSIDIPEEDNEVICRGSGLIFVVDDDALMMNISQSILEDCGYDVITANDGETAIELYRERFSEIKVVLLDLVMPGKSGEKTFIELKKINPDIKAILTSGFRKDERVDSALRLGINGFIQKPFTYKNLVVMVDKLINNVT